MRRMFSLILVCALMFAGAALANTDEKYDFTPTPIPAGTHFGVRTATDDGDCQLGLEALDSAAYGWSWLNFDGSARIYKVYLDPATDQRDGLCTPPLYPLQINSVYVPLFTFSAPTTIVGQTAIFRIDIECPANLYTAYPDYWNGPGTVICSQLVTHTITEEEANNQWVDLVVDLTEPCCVNRGFFMGITLVSWTGADPDDVPAPLSGRAPYPNAAGMKGKVWWWYGQSWGSPVRYSHPCWLEIVTTYVTPWGPWLMYADVTSNANCTPIPCYPCVPLPGDNVSNPIVIDRGQWQTVVDLCDYCPDYNQEGIGGSTSFTANGGDVVFEIAFDMSLPEVCWRLVLTPMCADTQTFFRIRSWLYDSQGYVYGGNPFYPTFGQSQVYDFTAAGPNGCLWPETYHLYLDTRGCCCPVLVTYIGDTPLAVEFGTFDATSGNNEVRLAWNTLSERAVNYFEILRDGVPTVHVNSLGDDPAGHSYAYTDHNVVNGTTYRYELAAHNNDGTIDHHPTVLLVTPSAENALINDYALLQNYPNPFNPSTAITYALKEAGEVTLKVFAVDGREVATLVNGRNASGTHTVLFNGDNLPSGLYVYQLKVNGFSATHKMVLMK
jgi:hypothetical protein